MITVRNNIFETNSSSTHCLVITTTDEWADFKDNKMFLDAYTGELTPIPEDMNVPKQLDDGRWEFNGNIYNELFDIETKEFEWYDRSQLFYDAYCEIGKDTCKRVLDDGKVAIAIYCYDD